MCGIHWCDAQHVKGAHTNRQKAYEKASVFILARRVKTSTALSKGMFWRDYQNISLLLAHSSFIKMRELKWYLSNPPFRKWCQNWHPPTKHFDLYWAIQFSYKHSQGKRVCPAFPEVLFLKSCPLCAHPLGFSCQTHCKGSGSKWTLAYVPPSIIQVYSRSFCLQNNTAEQKQWVDWVHVVVVFSSRLINTVITQWCCSWYPPSVAPERAVRAWVDIVSGLEPSACPGSIPPGFRAGGDEGNNPNNVCFPERHGHLDGCFISGDWFSAPYHQVLITPRWFLEVKGWTCSIVVLLLLFLFFFQRVS